MIIKKIQNNKYYKNGFVILYAMVISSILLAITLGVLNIALKEINFSTSGKDADDAFFAADTGAECALYWDNSISGQNAFTNGVPIVCAGSSNITLNGDSDSGSWNFTINTAGNSCAYITLTREPTGNVGFKTTIVSIGKSNCNAPNHVERELDVTY